MGDEPMHARNALSFRCGARVIDLPPNVDVAIVGYAGRDDAAVRAHIDELASHGVAPPANVPAVWRVSSDLLTQEGVVRARAGASSGEVEPVLVLVGDEAFVTVGSDHTDRDLERTSMDEAKRACAKVVGPECWPVPSVRDGWDALILSSAVEVNGGWRPYQQGALESLLPVDWYLETFGGDGPTVVFCGTVPAADGLVLDARAFRGALAAADGSRLELSYAIDVSGAAAGE